MLFSFRLTKPPFTENVTLLIWDASHKDGDSLPLVSPPTVAVPITPFTAGISIMTMFIIAPIPSASYFAPGSVITSIRFTIDAGIPANISFALFV